MKIKIYTRTGYIENQFDDYDKCKVYLEQLRDDGIDVTSYEIIFSDKFQGHPELSDDTYTNIIQRGLADFNGELDAFRALFGIDNKPTYH